jgi:glycoprotein-N-acetylgalactosamine 3-beta-galactosyltransferase
MNQLSKIIVGAVTVWVIIYIVVYLIFILSGDDTSLAEEGGHNEAFGGFKGKFLFNNLKKRVEDGVMKGKNGVWKGLHLDGGSVNGNNHHVAEYHHLAAFTATDIDIRKPELQSNPFTSDTCKNTIAQMAQSGVVQAQSVAVIIPVRNEEKESLLHTVKSIFANSGPELKTIVVVDDRSNDPIKEWPEWMHDNELALLKEARCAGGNTAQCLRVVRPKHRLGVSGAKAFGAEIFTQAHSHGNTHDSSVTALVFVDAHVVVSPAWLIGLAHTLHSNPSAIVYPAIDVIDRGSGGMARGGNVVGAFDWALGFRWEDVSGPDASSRLKLGAAGAVTADSLALSPAAPGIFGINTAFYRDIAGLDTTLTPWGQESVELSLRVWMCGGSVIRQPCARVAHRYDNLFSDTVASAGNGVSAASVDKNVMAVAEHWFPHRYRELVHKARFLGRVPYTVDVSHDARAPQVFHSSKALAQGSCQDLQWYLDEVYPGLQADVAAVEAAHAQHMASGYLETALAHALSAHYGPNRHAEEGGIERVLERAKTAEESRVQSEHDKLVPAAVYNPQKRPKNVPEAPKPVEIFVSDANGDPHETHANKIRQTLLCEDENIPGKPTCAERAKTSGCTRERYYMMFGCPKTCGMCGTDGKMCVDFFEKKCPVYAKEGRCVGEERLQMQHDCRLSCGHCHLPALAVGANNAHVVAGTAGDDMKARGGSSSLPHPDDHGKDQSPQVELPLPHKAPNVAAGTLDELVMSQEIAASVTVAQEEWRGKEAGEADYYQRGGNSVACPLPAQGSHVKLLGRISHALPPPAVAAAAAPRIFCGIYTYDRNHATNVKATRETWAKRCDGFLAFSTLTDPSIPSVNILHEGPEAYDNMWQKSRAIWRYIHTHLAAQYDFFLLGGDDMFYLIENLRAYLASHEVQERTMDPQTSGLFLGRRFFPPKQQVFNSGGAGYILDRKALEVLGANINSQKCWPHQKGFWEDVNVASCLRVSTEERKSWGPYGQIMPFDTRDQKKRERFHPFTPGQHLEYKKPRPGVKDWYVLCFTIVLPSFFSLIFDASLSLDLFSSSACVCILYTT